ncbi:hypothetical protein Dimus_025951 [Dionaea muscipula]
MAVSQVSASVNLLVHNAGCLSPSRTPSISPKHTSIFAPIAPSSLRGTPIVMQRSFHGMRAGCKARALVVRCEQSAEKGSGVDVWLGRLAMMGFAAAISVEITTGKGLLENFGLTAPLPAVALAVTGLVGVLTAIFIFQSASSD